MMDLFSTCIRTTSYSIIFSYSWFILLYCKPLIFPIFQIQFYFFFSVASNDEVASIPMFDQSHGNTPIKYVGIDVEIQKKKVRFMIDTGATINLIKKQTINQLGMYVPTALIFTFF